MHAQAKVTIHQGQQAASHPDPVTSPEGFIRLFDDYPVPQAGFGDYQASQLDILGLMLSIIIWHAPVCAFIEIIVYGSGLLIDSVKLFPLDEGLQ